MTLAERKAMGMTVDSNYGKRIDAKVVIVFRFR